MDLITLVATCALTVDPKLMHALIWHQSGGEPWSVSVAGERQPQVYRSALEAVRETQTAHPQRVPIRVGLTGLAAESTSATAAMFTPCLNISMAARQIAQLVERCKAAPSFKADPVRCAIAGVDYKGFAERCTGDRHHFRLIVSPDDAEQLSDLKGFTRDLMGQAERDLGTKLDWVAVDHWNTEHPHVHVIVRGVTDNEHDLVISRDYISQGLRARAGHLVTIELGPRTDLDIRRRLAAEIEPDRWTGLDRVLAIEATRHHRVVDLRPEADPTLDADTRSALVGRMRKLERLGLAEQLGSARWYLSERIEPTLRALGERSDIIRRIHKGLAEQQIERSIGDYVVEEGGSVWPMIGRLIARGLDDELQGSAYAVIDATDGRTHHVRLQDLDATSDGAPGSIVELRRFKDSRGRERTAIAVRSDLPLAAQVESTGATWLDRRLLAREPGTLSSGGFGLEVEQTMNARAEHLIRENLARHEGQRIIFARNLLDTRYWAAPRYRQFLYATLTRIAMGTAHCSDDTPHNLRVAHCRGLIAHPRG